MHTTQTGIVKHIFKRFGFISGKDQDIFFQFRDLVPDYLGRRSYLQQGDLVEFTAVWQEDKSDFHAKDITSATADYLSEIPDDYREICTVTSWTGKRSGFLDREHLGDISLKFYISDVVTTGIETLKPGSKVYCGLKRNASNPEKLQGHSIEIVKMD